MSTMSRYIRPMLNRNVAQLESIDNGFLVRFHEAVERKSSPGFRGQIDREVRAELEMSIPHWTTREVSLYCAGVDEVKAAIERAADEYAKLSELASKNDLDHAAGPPF